MPILSARRLAAVFCVFVFLKTSLAAVGTTVFPFLLVAPSARAGAMGQAYSAWAQGADAISINPAGLGRQRSKEISFQHLFYVENVSTDNFYWAQPTLKGGWGAQVGYVGAGGFKRTVADAAVPDGYRETGEFSTYSLQAAFAFAQKISNNVSIGALGRFIRESLSDASATGGTVDLGFLMQDPQYPLRLGIAVQNLGLAAKFAGESFSPPRLVRVGLAYDARPKTSPKWIPNETVVTAEFQRRWDEKDSGVGGGVEFPLGTPSLRLRAGYFTMLKTQDLGSTLSLPNGIALGFGLETRVGRIDYALQSLGELGSSHRIGLSVPFSAPWIDPSTRPSVISGSSLRTSPDRRTTLSEAMNHTVHGETEAKDGLSAGLGR